MLIHLSENKGGSMEKGNYELMSQFASIIWKFIKLQQRFSISHSEFILCWLL